jgi:ribosomal protein S12 methylthiotransferase accessory factor
MGMTKGATETRASVERTVSLAEASRRVTAALRKLGLHPELTDVGAGGNPTAIRCALLDGSGTMPFGAKGAGKGSQDEARVGAMFEALEHHLTGPSSFTPEHVRLLPAGDVAAGLRAEVSAKLLVEAPAEPLACWRYTRLHGDGELDVPVYLSSPWYVEDSGRPLREQVGDRFDYRAVGRYSTNSGSAIGVTEAEAVVHATNEIIERDAVSLLLVRCFFAEGHRPRLVDRASLPADLADLLAAVEERLGTTVYLLDITSDLDVPTMFAYVPPTSDRPHLRGVGTSLDSRYATQRALTELLQFMLLQEHVLPGGDPVAHLSVLRKYPALYRCGHADLTAHLARARVVPFSDRAYPAGVDAHLDELVDILAAHGFTPYLRRVRSLPGGIAAVHVIVPGMEHFGLVSQGLPILPGRRAMRARQDLAG